MTFRPVFIGGCDRSGTTLLGDLLGASSWALVTPESQFVHDLVVRLQLGAFATSHAAAQWLDTHFRFAAWHLQVQPRELARLIDLAAPRITVERLLTRYAETFHPRKPAADVWIDHTPDNFKSQPLLKRLFPEARFVHIVRDGRAVAASLKPLDWGPNNTYAASRHWATRLQQALTVEVAEGDNCLRVHFEDLVREPAAVLSRVCEFIHVPFDAAMLRGGGLVVPAFTRGQHRLVGSAVRADRVDTWRDRLSDAELRDFESHPLSHTLLERLGYEPRFSAPPTLPAARILACYCHEFLVYLWHRRRHKRMEQATVASSGQFDGVTGRAGAADRDVAAPTQLDLSRSTHV